MRMQDASHNTKFLFSNPFFVLFLRYVDSCRPTMTDDYFGVGVEEKNNDSKHNDVRDSFFL